MRAGESARAATDRVTAVLAEAVLAGDPLVADPPVVGDPVEPPPAADAAEPGRGMTGQAAADPATAGLPPVGQAEVRLAADPAAVRRELAVPGAGGDARALIAVT